MNSFNETTEIIVRTHLDNAGVPSKLAGYEYIKMAVGVIMENGELMRGITKVLYPLVAREYGTTPCAVERNMRTAIDSACKKGNQYLSSMSGEGTKLHFTNSEFIFKTVNIVKMHMSFVNNDEY